MAVLVSIATGNFTSASTWGVVVEASSSYLNAENVTESLVTQTYANTRSQSFTPGAVEISHIGVKLCERIGTSGTISVHLALNSTHVEVSGTEVTIDVDDLPAALEADINGGWIFFKLAAPVTLAAATAYEIEAKTQSASQVDLWCDGTSDNLARALVTTATATPGAGDTLIVAGEYIASNSSNTFTVTMDNTTTTDFGANSTSLVEPALAICSKGVLSYGTTAATNYYLKISGNAIIYTGGVLSIGTTGTPIPRDSTAVFELDCGTTDGEFGLIVRNLGTCNMQGLSRTSGKNVVSCLLNTDESPSATVLGVDTDTGWLSGDVIAIATTSRTSSESEDRILASNATATELTVTAGLTNAHSGTSPTQAEVILITRNVKFRSASASFMAYMYCALTSTVDIDWTEFRYLGEAATNKRGIEIATTTGSFNMQYSSVYDTEDGAVYITGSAVNYFTVDNNVFYNTNTSAGSNLTTIYIAQGTSGTAWSIQNNILIKPAATSTFGAINFGDIGGQMNGNTVVGGTNTNAGIYWNENSAAAATVADCVAHGCPGAGLWTHYATTVHFVDPIVWRNNGSGISTGGLSMAPQIITNPICFGNATYNISTNYVVTIKNPTLYSETSYPSQTGIAAGTGIVFVYGGTIGGAGGMAHTQSDVSASGLATTGQIHCFGTTLASAIEVQSMNLGGASALGCVRLHKHDGSSTTFKMICGPGRIESHNSDPERHTASGYSWKMTPAYANFKLVLPGPTPFDTFKAAVNASALVTISAYVRKNAAYGGSAPRLILCGGMVDGINSDVIDTHSAAADAWDQLVVTGTPSEAGVVEFYFDCDGTAGNVWVDDIEVTQA